MRAPVRAAFFSLIAAIAATREAFPQCPTNESLIPAPINLPFDIAAWPSAGLYVADANVINRFNPSTSVYESTTTSTTPGASGGVSVTPSVPYWFNPIVNSLVYWPGHGMVAGGNFTSIDGNAASHLAILGNSATTWQPLSVGGASMPVGDVSVDSANNLVVVGLFTTVGGVAANRIARSNGATWQAIGSGPSSAGDLGCVHANAPNDIVVGGFDAVAGTGFVEVWNGSAWTVIASASGTNGPIYGVRRTRNGDIYAIGAFGTIDGQSANNIAKWNGTTWVDIGGVLTYPWSIDELPSGDILVAGDLTMAGGQSCNGIARYSAAAPVPGWDHFSPNVGATGPFFTATYTEPLDDQKVYVAHVGGLVVISPPCYPATAVIGDTCSPTGLLGVPALRKLAIGPQLPWTGSTFKTYYFKPTSWPAGSTVVLGIGTLHPTQYQLNTVTPAHWTCMVYIEPTIDLIPLGTGTYYEIPLAIPAIPSLVGSSIYEQVLYYSSTSDSYSTNAFEITIGGF